MKVFSDKQEEFLELFRDNNTDVTSIDLSYQNIDDEGAKALAEALKMNTTLTSIRLLSRNKFGAEGEKALAEALKTNAGLTSI